MDSRIRKYCRHITRKHLEVLRIDKKTGVWYWDLPAAASVCYNKDMSKRGYSHFPNNTTWAEPLRQKIKELGELGHGTSLCSNPLGNCAEQHSGNKLLKAYKKIKQLEQLNFTETVRPRTMEILTPCMHCRKIFPKLK